MLFEIAVVLDCKVVDICRNKIQTRRSNAVRISTEFGVGYDISHNKSAKIVRQKTEEMRNLYDCYCILAGIKTQLPGVASDPDI